MPAMRIIYVSDQVGRVETVTAHFTHREEALAAFSAAGLRVLQIADMRAGERATDPVRVTMAAAALAPRARRASAAWRSAPPHAEILGKVTEVTAAAQRGA